MKNSLRRAVTAAAAVVAILGLGAGPALADSQSHQDPRGDVAKVDTSTRVKASIDLVRAVNGYEGSTLSLSMTGANLPGKGYIAVWIITTEDSNTYQLVVDHTSRKVLVDFAPTGSPRWSPRQSLAPGALCPGGVKAKVKGDVASGTIPRACLGGADEVRIATVMVEPVSDSQFKVDDARQKGYDFAEGPKFGPRLERN